MSNAEKVAEHAAGGCVGALALMLGDATGGTVAVAGSLAGLALLARKTWGSERDAVAARAALSARAAVADCHDFATADLGRVAVLLSAADIDPLTPEDLIAVVQGSETYRLAAPLAGVLHARIRFDGDSAANIALVRVALESAMSACCADRTFKNDLQTLLMMKSVRQNDAVLAILTEMRGSREAAERELGRREGLVIGLVRPIAQGVDDFDTAIRELERVVGTAADQERKAMMPSNPGDQVNAVLRRMQEQNRAGDLDGAAQTVDDSLGELEAEKARLLDAAVEQQILRRDAGATATRLWQRRQLDLPEGADRFDALRGLWQEWYVRGRDKGLNFDLEVAIRLAGISRNGAQTSDQRITALNSLGNALQILGERESGSDRLEKAVEAYREVLSERTQKSAPLHWAAILNNLGTALQTLGQREIGTGRLKDAVAAYREALLELPRKQFSLQWAATKNNLGSALTTIGQRETGTEMLEEAVAVCREALQERTRERVALQWAMSKHNLGNALLALGEREDRSDRLEEAIAAYREALLERSRKRVPLDWSLTKNNLGNALLALGQRENRADRLEDALSAYAKALLERPREKVPLDWAMTQNNLGNALLALGQREGTADRLEQAEASFRNAALEWHREKVPLQWAMLYNNRGELELAFFDKTGEASRLEAAEGSCRAALDVFEAAGARHYVSEVQGNLAAIAERRGRPGQVSDRDGVGA